MRAALPDPHRPGPIVGGRAGPWLPGGVSNADTGTAYGRPAGTSLRDLAQVGPGTPYGEVLRRYWQPVALSADATTTPKRLKILGEDLILFRTRRGKAGLVVPDCAH